MKTYLELLLSGSRAVRHRELELNDLGMVGRDWKFLEEEMVFGSQSVELAVSTGASCTPRRRAPNVPSAYAF